MVSPFTKRLLIILGLLIGLTMIFSACTTQKTQDVVSILVDITEADMPHVSASDLLHLDSLDYEDGNGQTIRITSINDIGMTSPTDVVLSMMNPYDTTTHGRTGQIREYQNNVQTALEAFASLRQERSASVIWKAISHELNVVASMQASHKVLIISSDLMETAVVNFYDPTVFNRLEANQAEYVDVFKSRYPITGNVSDIMVYLLYQPTSYANSQQFEAASAFFKTLLISQGVSDVQIGTSIVSSF